MLYEQIALWGGVLWYEYSSGISTNGDSHWKKLLHEDNKNTFRLLEEKRLIPHWLDELHYSDNKIKRLLIRLMHDPASFVLRFVPRKRRISLKGWGTAVCDSESLKEILGA